MQQDITTFEIGEAKLSLRENLRFSIQRGRYGKSYIIEDESAGAFYRIGEAEYTFLSLLDGQTTLASALATTCSHCGTSAFNENDAAQFCKWLVDAGLANTRASASARRVGARKTEADNVAAKQKLNPISIRVPLWNPDALVTAMSKYLAWILALPMAAVWCFVCLWALLSVGAASEQFTGELRVFSRDNAIWFAATWALLKMGHEFAHALACKKYGGRIGNCGVLFLLLIPLPFVDVTSSWRFGNKHHRILVSAAGMLFELFIAAIAALVWLRVGPGMLSQTAANVMIAASINTLLFNANPLMRFDGYHMLADWIEIPNLAKYGNQFVMGVCRKYLLGLSAAPIPWAGHRGQLVKLYGVASLLWKVLICITLVIAAANLLPGVGFAVATFGAALWLAMPTAKFIKYLVVGSEFEQPDRRRFAIVAGSFVAGVVTLGMVVPSPSVITAPIVIDYEPLSIVRAETSGFVTSIEVEEGEAVHKGQVLVRLKDPELTLRKVEAESKLKESRLRAAAHRKQRSIAAMQLEQETTVALQKQLAEIAVQENRLDVCAPSDGMVLATDLDSLLGTHIGLGTEILSIGRAGAKEAVGLVSQEADRFLRGSLGETVSLRVWGTSELKSGVIRTINPRVTPELPHFAFAGAYGGPLDVTQREQYESNDDADEGSLILIKPSVAIRISIDAATSEQLLAGQTGLVHLRMRSGSLGPYLIESSLAWLRDRITLTHGL